MSRELKLSIIQSILTDFSTQLTQYSLPSFLIPHITVPACLSGLAFWKASENYGKGIALSSATSLAIGSLMGGLFGMGSASTFFHDRKTIKQKIADNISLINQYINNDEQIILLSNEKIQCIYNILSQYNARQNTASSDYLLNAFATFTTAITTYATGSLLFFISNDQPKTRWIVGVTSSLALGLTEAVLAHKGQKQDNNLKIISILTEAIKRVILSGQNEVSSYYYSSGDTLESAYSQFDSGP